VKLFVKFRIAIGLVADTQLIQRIKKEEIQWQWPVGIYNIIFSQFIVIHLTLNAAMLNT